MSGRIRIENGLYTYGRKRIPLISGEFHYWRVLRENWEPIVARIKDMGLNVVASYVPWNYHELSPGKYDFSGRTSPQRDLDGFVRLLRKEGLYLIARPGPYIYSEWPFGGVPERAAQHDRLSAEFLGMARHYIEHVSEVLVPHQITRGGNIILVQSDNEPYPPVESFGNQIGCFRDKGMFKDWLREKYAGDLDLLNCRWKTDFKSFDEPCFHFHEAYVNTNLPLAGRLLPDHEYRVRYADAFDFIGWYAARIVQTVGGWLKEAGVEVPIYANSWSPLYADFAQFCRVSAMAGSDIYPPAYMDGAGATSDDWQYNVDIIKMQEADVTDGNVWSAEFQSGIYPIRSVGYLPPNHFKFVPCTLMSRGLKGWNWYMLVNRDNWHHCPINEWGRTNEYYPVHKQVVAAARRIEPWNLQELYDLSLFVCKAHRVISPGNFDEVFGVLEAGNFSYAYYDPASDNPPRSPIMLYSGAEWLEAETSAKLEAFVRSGGTLVAFSRVPTRNEFDEPLQGLGFQKPDGARPTNLPVRVAYRGGALEIKQGGHCGSKVNFCYFKDVRGLPMVLTLSTKAKEVLVDIGAADATAFAMGYTRKVGKGKIIHIGSNPSAELLRLVLAREGVSPWTACSDVRMKTSLHRHRDGSLVLFVTNRGREPSRADISLNVARLGIRPGASFVMDPVFSGERRRVRGSELASLTLPMEGQDVGIWKLVPSMAAR